MSGVDIIKRGYMTVDGVITIDGCISIIDGCHDHDDDLDVIHEEHCYEKGSLKSLEDQPQRDVCNCKSEPEPPPPEPEKIDVQKLLLHKEESMRHEFKCDMEKEINQMKDRFDLILRNEQIRTSYMLREAHRERQEKINALQTQLQCKNLAGLMYVLCTEKRKNKLETLRIVEEYSNYIKALKKILIDSQSLILRLSRGFKTAARVDHEWKEKMKKIIAEFQAYVYNFNGGTPESNQYIFDIPALMKVDAPLTDDPKEDPCESPALPDEPDDKSVDDCSCPWWSRVESCGERPFVVFGDMADFDPPERRILLKAYRPPPSAPRKWKDYAFRDMYVKETCKNADYIKDEYPRHLGSIPKWECRTYNNEDDDTDSSERRAMSASIDLRGNVMGSILKIITSTAQPNNKTNLLGARDSMEIQSTTKLRERHKRISSSKVIINDPVKIPVILTDTEEPAEVLQLKEDTDYPGSYLGTIHHDSLEVLHNHQPEVDHKINYEKVCPMDKCGRMQVDEFMRTLPKYMTASPFTHFEQTFDEYETCSPEQLELLKQRIEERRRSQKLANIAEPLAEWTLTGVGVQTSDLSIPNLPPCTCGNVYRGFELPSTAKAFKVEDLLPAKLAVDIIAKECFGDPNIDFNRFEVLGQDSNQNTKEKQKDFKTARVGEIKKILKQHPSLLDIFQGNTQC